MVDVFSVSAFFIVLREVLEACLIVGIILAYLKRIGSEHLNKYVWIGTAVGIGISIIIGIVFGVLFHTKGDSLFTGATEYIFEGITFLVASILLTWMILWMLSMGKNLKTEIEKQVESTLIKGGPWWLCFLVFTQILREGIETVIFIIGAAGTDNWQSIPIPAILGIAVGIILALLLFKGLLHLDVGTFFFATSLILIAFAAGLVSRAFHEFQEVPWFGTYDSNDVTEITWWNQRLWNTVECCNDKTNEFFAMLRALFGYQDKPTWLEVFTYFAYWWVVTALVVLVYIDRIRIARNGTALFVKISALMLWCACFIGFIYSCTNPTWIGVLAGCLGWILSNLSCLVAFDTFSRIGFIRKWRKTLAWTAGIGWGLLATLCFSLNIAQSACENGAQGRQCNLPYYYYFLLFFNEHWSQQGPTGKQYNSLALLVISLVFIVFWCGFHSFYQIRYAMNINEEGQYVYNQHGDHHLFQETDESMDFTEVGQQLGYDTRKPEIEPFVEKTDDLEKAENPLNANDDAKSVESAI